MKSFGYILTLVFVGCISTIGSSQFPGFGQPSSSSDIASDTTNQKFFTIFKGNPGRATLYSLVLPGAGQLYNKRWWKVPLVYALEGTAIYFYIQNRNLFNKLDDCYFGLIEDSLNPSAQCELSSGRIITDQSTAFQFRNQARNRKETAFLVSIGAHLFQALEAFIDRHLIDFDVDEDLTFKFGPTEISPHTFDTQSINIVTIGFPIGR